MEDNELKVLWASYNEKVDKSLQISQKLLDNSSDLRVKTLLNSMKPTKIALVIVGLVWVFFIDSLVIDTFGEASLFFTISAGLQSVISKIAIGVYIYQLVLINQIDLTQPLVSTQEKLSTLKATSLGIARVLFLQLPLWSTFYLHDALFVKENFFWLGFQLTITADLTWLAVWLFFNIKYENRHKKWFKWLFDGKDWTPVIQAMEVLAEVKEFKKN
ncbi:MAG: hypothetical protein ACK4NY_01785 [Spirosomataceae bacterium]